MRGLVRLLVLAAAGLFLPGHVLAAGEATGSAAKAWPTPSFRGRPFWPLFAKRSHKPEHYGPGAQGQPSTRGLEELPLVESYATMLQPERRLGLRDFIRGDYDVQTWRKLKPRDGEKFVYARRVPDERLYRGSYTFGDVLGPGLRELVCAPVWTDKRLFCPQPGAPLLMAMADSRPVYFLQNDLRPDRASFLAWKAQHPEFLGFYAMGEIDSDTGNYVGGMEGNHRWRPPEEEVRRELASRFPPPHDRWEWFENLRRVWAKMVELHFGEDSFWPLYCNNCSLAHMNAALGAVGLINETSTSAGSPFAFSGMYTRGASRQFGIPFVWYTACCYYGYFRDGRKNGFYGSNGNNRWPRDGKVTAKSVRPYGGASMSLMARHDTYGWLIGAAMIQEECWSQYSASATNGVPCPSPYALNFNLLLERSRRMDRGASHTPLAILAPLTESFGRNGYVADPGNGCQLHLPAWLLTLVPTRETSDPEGSLDARRKHGDEGCFFNSPYGDIADVLVADSGQASGKFAEALLHYDLAVLAGTYRTNELDRTALEDYVKRGGTLLVTADYVEEGLLPCAFAGVTFDGWRVRSGKVARNRSGADVAALNGAYDLYAAAPSTAVPFLTDEEGHIVAFENRLGRGRVLTLAARRGLPRRYTGGDARSLAAAEAEIRSGRGELGLIRYFLDDLQGRAIPVTIQGDVFWGMSRTAKGWFLWLFNNKGVAKYVEEPAEFDLSKTAKVRVGLRALSKADVRDADTGERLSASEDVVELTVPPGGMRFVSMNVGSDSF